MGSVFKRIRVHKSGRKVNYWYIVYSINGKRKWKAVGENNCRKVSGLDGLLPKY